MNDVRRIGPRRRNQSGTTSVNVDLGAIVERIAILIDAMRDWGWLPFPKAPDGFRYKTRAEYAAEYLDAGTTAARRQEILAIRCGLRPQETVALQS